MTRFEWDERKNLSNRNKHGITFPQATDVFRDPFAVLNPDRVIDGEKRWHTIGVRGNTLLLVVHTIKEDETDEVIRIISARLTTPGERQFYEAENRKLYL